MASRRSLRLVPRWSTARYALVSAALCACAALAALWFFDRGVGSGDAKPATGSPALTDGLQRAQRQIAEHEYQASRTAAGLQAPNRAHALRTWFEPTGIRLHDRTAAESPRLAELRLAGVGRGEARLAAVAPGTVVSEGPRVEIRRPGLVEWYVNTPEGIEQGFTLERRPVGAGALVLELEVEGAEARPHGDAVVLASAAGRQLGYGQLHVLDAAGAAQAARIEVPSASRVRLVIEDAGAAYPLLIDPVIYGFAHTQLESDQAVAHLGSSVAGAGDVNGDGYDDVIVGAPLYDAG